MVKRVAAVVILLLIILLFTVLAVISERQKHSSELTTVTAEEGNTTTTSYVDENHQIIFASDKGYASVRRTYDDGKLIFEEYLDEKGRPVTLAEGYSAISRTYADDTIITYLDKDGKPVVTTWGFDSIHRSCYSSDLAGTDIYFIGEDQVQRSSGYWQLHREYEDDRLSEIRYEDRDGRLSTETTFGYSLVRRFYTDLDYIDMYFDEKELPAAGPLGEYGVKVEGDTTTYFDAGGMPRNTKRGYAIVVKDGAKTLYYDQDGSPATIGRSQYGIQYVNGQSVYLDENGEPMLRLDNILNTHPVLVVVVTVLLTALAVLLRGRPRALFVILYIGAVIYMTMVYRETGDSRGVKRKS